MANIFLAMATAEARSMSCRLLSSTSIATGGLAVYICLETLFLAMFCILAASVLDISLLDDGGVGELGGLELWDDVAAFNAQEE
jgi:hypothetical protein